MDLKRIEYFEAVSRLKSFTKASEELHVAQPSITTSIQKLEDELGVALLLRSRREVTLTEEGEIFLKCVKNILREIQSTVAEMEDLRKSAKRILKFAAPPSLGEWIFPIMFNDFIEEYRDIQLDVFEAGSYEIMEKLENESIELGYVVYSDKTEGYNTLPIQTGEMYTVLPKNHKLCSYERIPFELLRNTGFVMHYSGTFICQSVMSQCQKHNFKPNIIFEPKQTTTILNMIENGVGIGFVLDDEISAIKHNSNIEVRKFQEPVVFQAGFIWSKNRYLSRASKQFIDYIVASKRK